MDMEKAMDALQELEQFFFYTRNRETDTIKRLRLTEIREDLKLAIESLAELEKEA